MTHLVSYPQQLAWESTNTHLLKAHELIDLEAMKQSGARQEEHPKMGLQSQQAHGQSLAQTL